MRAALLTAALLMALPGVAGAQDETAALRSAAASWRAEDGQARRALEASIAATSTPAQLMDALQHKPQASKAGRIHRRIRAGRRRTHYIAHVPEGPSPSAGWPVHITLHGGGGTPGRSCDVNWRGEAAQSGVLLLCPALPEGVQWYMQAGEETVLSSLRDVATVYPLDTERVSLGGASSGGAGVWRTATRHPWLFRGIVARCAAAPPQPRAVRNLGGLQTLLLHGRNDRRIAATQSQRALTMLREVHAPVQFMEHPAAGHRFLRAYNTVALATLPAQRSRQTAFSYEVTHKTPPARVHWLRAAWGRGGQRIQGVWTTSSHGYRATLHVPPGTVGLQIFPPEALPPAPVEVIVNGALRGTYTPTHTVTSVLRSWEDYGDPGLLRSWSVQLEDRPVPTS